MLILDDLNQCGLNKSRPKRFFFRELGLKWSYRQFKSHPATKRTVAYHTESLSEKLFKKVVSCHKTAEMS